MPLFPVPLDCSSSIYPGLRLLCPGSASAFSPPLPDLGWAVSRGGNVRFMLRPGELLALHRQELLLSSFRFLGSPPENVEYNYPAKQSIAGARLSLARHAALWAANRDHRVLESEKIKGKCQVSKVIRLRRDKVDDLVKSPKAPFPVIPAPIFIGINSSRNPVISKSYQTFGLRFSPVCQAQAGRSDDFFRGHQSFTN